MAALLHQPFEFDLELLAETTLNPSFQPALGSGSFSLAYSLASTYKDCIAKPGRIKLLRDLAEYSAAPAAVRADAWLVLVSESRDLASAAEVHRYLKNAKELYLQVSHAPGLLDVEFLEICLDMESVQRGEKEQGWPTPDIESLFKRYERLDYPAGHERALYRFLEVIKSPATFDLQLEVMQRIQDISKKTGQTFSTVMQRFAVTGLWLKQSTHFAAILESVTSLWDQLEGTDWRYIAGLAAHYACNVYTMIQDSANAVLWGERILKMWAHCLPADRATASVALMRAKLIRIDTVALNDLVEASEVEIDEDIRNAFYDEAVDKLESLLLEMLAVQENQSRPSHNRAQSMIARVKNCLPHLNGPGAVMKAATLDQIRMTMFLAEAKADPKTCLKENQALELEEKVVQRYLENKMILEAANVRMMGAMCHFSIFQKTGNSQSLQQCYDRFSTARDAFKALDNIGYLKSAVYWVAFTLYEGWKRGWVRSNNVLEELCRAEKLSDEERSEISILGHMDAIETKQRMGSHRHVRNIYQFAIDICLRESMDTELWGWIQRAKGRSLSDIMGLGILVPQHLRSKIHNDPVLKSLLEDESKLIQQLQEMQPSKRIEVRHQLEQLRLRMKGHATLSELVSLREGQPVNLQDAQRMSMSPHGGDVSCRLVFVDWFICNDEIHLSILRGDENPTFHRTCQTASTVQRWKHRYLDSKEGRELSLESDDNEDSVLRQLDDLIQPLADICSAGDIVILSPTRSLNSVPLHALWIRPDETLIESHAVVYCASITTFIQCMQRHQQMAETEPEHRYERTLVAVYERSKGVDFHEEEQRAIYSHVSKLAAEFSMNQVIGKAVTPQDFVDTLSRADWFHFHGHCIFEEKNIMDQSLLLANGEVRVKDFFSLSLQNPHVTLIACDSASQSIMDGDEPLGILTALLCAGASSVVGTIWPTASGVGRLFSTFLYEEIVRCSQQGDLVNLAVSVREAVLDIKSNWRTRQPYYWAPFVLHGSVSRRLHSNNQKMRLLAGER